MKHWRIDDVSWDRFDRSQLDEDVIKLVKAAAMVERNGTDYAVYLKNVFQDDPDFKLAADNWAVEEVQHGDALGRWAMLADPQWDYAACFARYDHMKRYLSREKLGMISRLKIAAGRITETEDDELAFAFHCSNDPVGTPYVHKRSIAGYMSRAMRFYRLRHIERSIGMILKSVGLPPRGRLSAVATNLFWRVLQRKRRQFEAVAA